MTAAGIRALITQTEGWRAQHVAANRSVEALACNIRIKALKDALALIARAEADGGQNGQ